MIQKFEPAALIKYAKSNGKVIKSKQQCFDENGNKIDRVVYTTVLPRCLLHIPGLKSIECDLSYHLSVYIEKLIF